MDITPTEVCKIAKMPFKKYKFASSSLLPLQSVVDLGGISTRILET
jgi:hypothetical protein